MLNKSHLKSKFFTYHLFPLAFYLLAFSILTYPYVTTFWDELWATAWDGFPNYWNLWWYKKAVLELGTDPWTTTSQYFPQGSSLLGHPLNPYSGIIAILTAPFFTLAQSYNFTQLTNVILSGYTMFHLSRYVSKSYLGGLVAGYVYTFSHLHFGYMFAQLELATMQWLPLYLLCLLKLLQKPTYTHAVGTAASLWLISLVSNYHLLFAALCTILVVVHHVTIKRSVTHLWSPAYRKYLLLTAILVAISSGPHVKAIADSNTIDPIQGGHVAESFGLDPVGMGIPSKFWRFNSQTERYWKEVNFQYNENGVYLGLGAIMLAYLGLKHQKGKKHTNLWLWIWLVFVILSLGPWLTLAGKLIKPYELLLPYDYLARLLPILKIAGVPIRMMVMVVLATAVMAAVGTVYLEKNYPRTKRLLIIILAIVVIDSLPSPLYSQELEVSPHALAIRDASAPGAVIDTYSSPEYYVYDQTIHGKPLVLGSLAKLPLSVSQTKKAKEQLIEEQDFWTLHHTFQVDYLVSGDRDIPDLDILYQDEELTVYNLATTDWSDIPIGDEDQL